VCVNMHGIMVCLDRRLDPK